MLLVDKDDATESLVYSKSIYRLTMAGASVLLDLCIILCSPLTYIDRRS